jgi:dTDP-4-amino-4,6-dideoxygalactose transaminase
MLSESAVYCPVLLHQHEIFMKIYNFSEKLTQGEMCSQEVFFLPMFPELSQEEIRVIADVVNNFF